MRIFAYRSTMPFNNRGTDGMPSISPTTNKSTIPTNNVPTIQDFLNGTTTMSDILPGGGGDWSPGEDVSKSYKDKGSDYKRKERDLGILNKMMMPREMPDGKWEVRVDGGSVSFVSFQMAQKYARENQIPFKYIQKVQITAQANHPLTTVDVVANSIDKCFLVESINVSAGVKENGASFCVYPNFFLTCAHVIKKYNKNQAQNLAEWGGKQGPIISLIQNGKKHRAEVVAVNTKWDMALLKSDIEVEPLEIDTSVAIGEDIIAIGSPHGYENHVSTGSIGSLDRKVYFYSNAPDYMFVDLAVHPGNSGGPIIKENNGKVVGLVTLIISTSGEYGLNAALPSKYIQSFLQKNIEGY